MKIKSTIEILIDTMQDDLTYASDAAYDARDKDPDIDKWEVMARYLIQHCGWTK